MFPRVDIVTKGMQKQKAKSKKRNYPRSSNFNFRDGITMETLDRPNRISITFYESDMDAVLVPYNDLMVITTTIGEFSISRLLVDEGSALSLLYLKCWPKMELRDEFIVKDVGELFSLNGSTSKPYGRTVLDIVVHNKVVSIDFYLMDYNDPNNEPLGHD